jgi:uncharacterized protein (DUF927 family)
MPKKAPGNKPANERVSSADADITADDTNTKKAPNTKKASKSTEKRASALKPRTADDIANEQTAERLALQIWAATVGGKITKDLSAFMDELVESYSLDDDDEEGDEGWLDERQKQEKKLLDEAIVDGLDEFPDISAINTIPPSPDSNPDSKIDSKIVEDAKQLRDVLTKCPIGATKLNEKFSRAQLQRMIKLNVVERLKENPKYSEHVREDVPGSNVTKYGNRGRTSSRGTFARATDYMSGGGLDMLLTGGWIRVAKDRIDPVAWSYQFDLERKTERQNWVQHYRITERSGKKSPYELPRQLLSGIGTLATRDLRKAGILIIRRDAVQKALMRYLDIKPKLEIVRMPQVGFFEVDGHYICVRSNETLLPPALKELENVAYRADKAHDPDHYGRQIKGTTADWQREVAIPLRGNSNVALAFATSFASALIPFAKEQRGGAHLWGTSGIGKSIAISAGESIYGLPSASQNRRSFGRSLAVTSTGLEDLLPFRNHAGLFLDELQRVPPELRGIVVQLIYAFTQAPKVRGGSWRLQGDDVGQVFLLTSGEDSIGKFVGREKDRLGRERRMPDIPAEVRDGSALETMDHDTVEEKAPAFYSVMITQCHGAAGRDWQKWLVELGAVKIRERIDQERQAFLALPQVQNISRRAQPELRSIIRRFALYAASLHLAIEANILLWTGEEADTGLTACLERWVQQRGNIDPAIAQSRFITDFMRKLAADLSDRFIHIRKVKGRFVPATDSDTAKLQNSSAAYDGFVKPGKDGEDELVLIRPEAFEKRCAGADPAAIARHLHAEGDLLASDKGGKLSKTVQTLGQSERFYVFRRTALVLPDTPDTSDPGK